jgi:NADPH:quinone reductase-like Zn-dependent oxidoreductase
MKAIYFDHYGPPEVLSLREVPRPVPQAGEVLIKVRASSVNAADWHIMRADPFPARLMFGLFKPRFHFLGLDVAGVVEAVGPGVSEFKAGDEVFGCLSFPALGAFAEYVCVREDLLALKPSKMDFDEAAAVPLAGGTALRALVDHGRVKAGMKVLINGAAGGVGTFAVQIARALGAEVTAVCSERNLDQARSLGATHVIDYAREDFTQADKRYDMILAANGYHPLPAYKRSLAPSGIYAMTGGKGRQMAEALLFGKLLAMGSGKTLGTVDYKPRKSDVLSLKGLIEAGKLVSAIDRRFSLEQVPAAIAYLEEGHARGKVVITV